MFLTDTQKAAAANRRQIAAMFRTDGRPVDRQFLVHASDKAQALDLAREQALNGDYKLRCQVVSGPTQLDGERWSVTLEVTRS
jgi:hypothetical protein